jgi:hypothetical protein
MLKKNIPPTTDIESNNNMSTNTRPSNEGETDALLTSTRPSIANKSKDFSSSASWFFPLYHYLIMCFTFSVPYGAMVVAYGYAGAAFDLTQSSFSSGIAYLVAVTTSIFLAVPMIENFGATRMLIMSMFCYLITLSFFAFAANLDVSEDAEWTLLIIGGIGTGIALGTTNAYAQIFINVHPHVPPFLSLSRCFIRSLFIQQVWGGSLKAFTFP